MTTLSIGSVRDMLVLGIGRSLILQVLIIVRIIWSIFPGSGQEKHCFLKKFYEALCESLVIYVTVRE